MQYKKFILTIAIFVLSMSLILIAQTCVSCSQPQDQLAYLTGSPGRTQIYLQGISGRTLNLSKVFGIDRVADILPAWSLDGKYIAYIGHLESEVDLYALHLVIVDAENLEAQTYSLPPECYLHQMTWAVDSTELLLTLSCSKVPGIWRLERGSGQIELVFPLPANVGEVAWSPDRTRIAITSNSYFGPLSIQSIQGTFQELIHNQTIGHLAWSPDGKFIAFEAYDDTTADSQSHSRLCWRAVAGGAVQCLKEYSQYPVWTNDSTQIAYLGYESGYEGWLGLVNPLTNAVEVLAEVDTSGQVAP